MTRQNRLSGAAREKHPNQLLRQAREQRGWSQERVAQELKVSSNTVSRWECGTALPYPHFREQLCRLFEKSLEELGLTQERAGERSGLSPSEALPAPSVLPPVLPPAQAASVPALWYVPSHRNAFFTGREEILEALHTQLSTDRAVALTQLAALYGMGGVGKTQIALEYAYRHAQDYRAIFWLAAETEEQILTSFLRVASVLGLPERDEQNQQRVVAAVQRWLVAHDHWLLIWDNVEEQELLTRYLPTTSSGAVLITTRCQVLGTLARGLNLLPMEPEEGVLFLLCRAKILTPGATREQLYRFAEQMPAQYTAAVELVTALGGLPLALDQAGAYLEATHCGVPAYLDRFQRRRAALLKLRGEGVRDHPASVSTTFALALRTTAQRHPAVLDLLRACAFLQPDAIPEEIFLQGGEHLGATLEAVCHDLLEWDHVVGVTCSSSLLSRQVEEQSLSLHRLVQAVLLDGMTEAEREQWNVRLIRALDAVFPEVRPLTAALAVRKQAERLLPHTLLCLQRPGGSEDSLCFASLAYKAAQFLREGSRYAEAKPLFERAMHSYEQVLGPACSQVATVLNYLGILYAQQGQYAEAKPLFERAVSINEQVLGPNHPEVARPLDNLAALLANQGRYAEARSLHYRALSLREQGLGPAHPEVAITLSNLGDLYAKWRRYAEAKPFFERAVQIYERLPASRVMANALNGLGEVYREMGQYAEAQRILERALHLWRDLLGPMHPEVAHALAHLGRLAFVQGDNACAARLYQCALATWEHNAAYEPADFATLLVHLAELSQGQGKSAEATSLYQRALSIREQYLGPTHPETAYTLYDLAFLCHKEGNLREACALAQRALTVCSQALGNAHPKTIAAQALVVQLLQEQTNAGVEAVASRHSETPGAPRSNARQEDSTSSPFPEAVPLAPAEYDPLQRFLDACCERHPLAWCRSADLWQAYQGWVKACQERYSLSRGAFIAQVKAHGCHADRTKRARIWRGITLVSKNDDGR